MSNVVVKSISQNKETFTNFRIWLMQHGYTKEQVLQLESMNINEYIPRCIKYIESLDISFNEVINYYVWDRPDLSYWDLVIVSVVGAFRKIENKDINFTLF